VTLRQRREKKMTTNGRGYFLGVIWYCLYLKARRSLVQLNGWVSVRIASRQKGPNEWNQNFDQFTLLYSNFVISYSFPSLCGLRHNSQIIIIYLYRYRRLRHPPPLPSTPSFTHVRRILAKAEEGTTGDPHRTGRPCQESCRCVYASLPEIKAPFNPSTEQVFSCSKPRISRRGTFP
jgi:hypothetical protein